MTATFALSVPDAACPPRDGTRAAEPPAHPRRPEPDRRPRLGVGNRRDDAPEPRHPSPGGGRAPRTGRPRTSADLKLDRPRRFENLLGGDGGLGVGHPIRRSNRSRTVHTLPLFRRRRHRLCLILLLRGAASPNLRCCWMNGRTAWTLRMSVRVPPLPKVHPYPNPADPAGVSEPEQTERAQRSSFENQARFQVRIVRRRSGDYGVAADVPRSPPPLRRLMSQPLPTSDFQTRAGTPRESRGLPR